MTFLQRRLRTEDLPGSPASGQVSAPYGWAERLLERRFANLTTALDTASRSFWCRMRPEGRPSYTMALMQDITDLQLAIRQGFAQAPVDEERPFDYFVFASALPGIYNLGGDLGHFAERIRQRDRASLTRYGHVAVEAIHRNATAFDSPVITMALVQGDALGGGFECALSLDLIVAERSAKMGLPEILFNLFPGMGAYSFLSRRMGMMEAEKLILSGRIYTAEELHGMGVVDVLAEDGQGREAALDYIARHGRRHNAHLHTYRARRRVQPVTLEELRDVVDIWVEACLQLEEPDLRKMLRLCAAQDRRLAGEASARAS